MQIVLLSGRIRAGKSTLAQELARRYKAHIVKTRTLIERERSISGARREDFQAAGEDLDRRTDGEWVGRALYAELEALPHEPELVIVDSVRIRQQIEYIRRAFKRGVVHVHLTISEEGANTRLPAGRAEKNFAEVDNYRQAQQSQTEAQIENLAQCADVRIDTERDRAEDILIRVAAQLGLLTVSPSSYLDVLIGGQYGSEGKGQIAWHLADEYDYLIRVGGTNAGHTVPTSPVMDSGDAPARPFVFHMLPSGSAETKGKLMLGPGATISLDWLQHEINQCRIDKDRLVIDEQAIIVEPEDIEFEKTSIKDMIGSTAQGVGHATARRVMRGALKPPIRLARDIPDLKPYLARTADILQEAFASGKRLFVEGTQGSGLSLYHGHYPHVTSRETNLAGLLAETGIAAARVRRVILVVRTYPIRVQNPDDVKKTSGFMSREITWDEVAHRAGLDAAALKEAEKTSTTRRDRRVGEFDWVLLRRAVDLNAPTDIALTFADYISAENKDARRFEQLTSETQRFVMEVERVSGASVSLISTGHSPYSVIDRRSW